MREPLNRSTFNYIHRTKIKAETAACGVWVGLSLLELSADQSLFMRKNKV